MNPKLLPILCACFAIALALPRAAAAEAPSGPPAVVRLSDTVQASIPPELEKETVGWATARIGEILTFDIASREAHFNEVIAPHFVSPDARKAFVAEVGEAGFAKAGAHPLVAGGTLAPGAATVAGYGLLNGDHVWNIYMLVRVTYPDAPCVTGACEEYTYGMNMSVWQSGKSPDVRHIGGLTFERDLDGKIARQ